MGLIKVDGNRDIKKLIISILLSEGVGALAGFLTKDSMKLFESLNKPGFAPPAIVFPIVWPILYLLMGIAAYRIWMKGGDLTLYFIQLAVNFIWPIVFFKFGLIGAGFLVILVLLILITLTTLQFYKIDKTAAYLMLPYLLWVAFATVLNYFIVKLN